MKNFNFVQILGMLVLVVTLASCGLTQPGYGDNEYPDRTVRSRQIYSDPYYNSGTTIVRDPYTGRYYEVTPVAPYGYDPYLSPYSTYGNTRYYGRSTSRGYSSGAPRRAQQTETQQQNRGSETTKKAKDIIRGDR
jgi:hypothetical protein